MQTQDIVKGADQNAAKQVGGHSRPHLRISKPIRQAPFLVALGMVVLQTGCNPVDIRRDELRQGLVDSYHSPTHQATIRLNVSDGSHIYELDEKSVSFQAYHPIDAMPFTPRRIVDVFDLPNQGAGYT